MSIALEMSSLRNRAWTTAGARYNAARRLRTRAKFSLMTISLTSAIGVAVPLLLATDGVNLNSSIVSAYAALLSLFILVIAIIEGASAHEARADTLYRSAEKLNAFRLELNSMLADPSQCTATLLNKVTEEYGKILETCSLNHELVDYELMRRMSPGEFGLDNSFFWLQVAKVRFYLFSTWWLGVLLMCAIVGLIIVLSVPRP